MESPKESANLYKIGTKKLGLNDDYYYVLNYNKSDRKMYASINHTALIFEV